MENYKKSCLEKYDDRDYIEEFGGIDLNSYEGEERSVGCFSNIKYNQKLVDDYSCSGQTSCGTISDVTDYAISLTNRKNTWNRQLKTGAVEGHGDTLINGVKQAVKDFNEDNPELPFKIGYFRLKNIKSDELFKVLKGSSIITGYKGSLYSDAQDNGEINNTDNKGTGGHCIRIVKSWKEGKETIIKYCDNYEGVNKYNIITVPNFQDNKDFFTGGYYLKKIAR